MRKWHNEFHLNSRSKNRVAMAEKIVRADAGDMEVRFEPYEFLSYVLHKQDLAEATLSSKLGFNEGYISERMNFFRPAEIYEHTAVKLAHLTNTEASFWMQKSYTPKDAENIAFDLTKDASDIAVPHVGSHLARRRREEEKKDKGFDGIGIA